jgi:HAD superfamily hydrolase (TIGR01509 family)
MIKAVLFDLDGVLVNSEPANVAAGVDAFRDLGIILSSSEKKQIMGRHPADYDKVFRYDFDRRRMIEGHHKYYDKYYYKTKPFPHAGKLVLALKRKNFKVAVVTASELGTVKRALKLVKLLGAFDALITFETCKKRKPAPDPYLTAARLLKVKPSECVVIEDSIPGVTAAKHAKMRCIAVTNSFPASKLRKADLIVKSLNDKRIMELLTC